MILAIAKSYEAGAGLWWWSFIVRVWPETKHGGSICPDTGLAEGRHNVGPYPTREAAEEHRRARADKIGEAYSEDVIRNAQWPRDPGNS